MKTVMKIVFTPAMLLMRLALALTACIASIASTVIGLCTSIFVLLGIAQFCIGFWQNGIAFFVLALLTSPIGLPMIANFLLNRLDHILSFLEHSLS